WNIPAFYDAEPGRPGRTNARWGGFIEGIDQFDPAFFGISPREAALMDPQQRLLLETAWESLEDAGFVTDSVAGSSTGVFVGISTFDYWRIQASYRDKTSIETHSTTGTVLSIAANRISYLFNLHGPSLAVDTACSSSLVAVHLACRSLRNGECSTALAGGVNAILIPDTFIGFSQMSMLSPDGRCRAFDARGNGFVRSEGAGVIVLKPLSAARADGDRVYAVIRGSAVNQDGRTSSLTVPGLDSQKDLIREACRDAKVDPAEIDYVEAHGTGTAVGDPIETGAIGAVLAANRRRPCVIGSVKTNIGHLEAGSGIAGIIKTALVLDRGEVPPNLHFEEPNPAIDFKNWKLRVPVALEKLPRPEAIAAINSFGFGGTNAHVILQGVPRELPTPVLESGGTDLFVLSARDPGGLRALASQYAAWLDTTGESLENICHTLGFRRVHHPHRIAIAAVSKAEVSEKLHAYLAGEARPGLSAGTARPPHNAVFVFSGQGPQWWGMGRELLASHRGFRDKIAECDALFRQWGNWSLLEEMQRDEATSRMNLPSIAQPAIFALQVALTLWWRENGVEPAAVIGHSVGEAAAAHVSGALDLPSAARVIFERGRCMELVPPTGKMLAAALSPDAAVPWLAGFKRRVEIGAVNSPRSITISGEPAALDELARKLEASGIWCRFLRVNYAFHSAQMDPVKKTLKAALRGITSQTPVIPICST
ncbi:MAG: type I polyketide synthase, partial [Terrimicrobiaceae bacterium]